MACRVETALQEISNTHLCFMPNDPCTIEEFTKLAEETAQKAIVLLTKYIKFCEAALVDILETLKKHLNESDKKLVSYGQDSDYYECIMKQEGKGKAQRCQECLSCIYFNFLTLYTQRNNEALILCTKNSLDSIKKRLQQSNKYVGGQVIREKVKNPLLKAHIILAIPNIAVKPTLDDMQQHLNKTIQNMLRISMDLPEWNHSVKLRELQIKEIEKQAIEEGEDPKAAVTAKMPKVTC